MKNLILLAAALGFLVVVPSLALADETMEVYADSSMAGLSGSLVRFTEPGFPAETVFVFEESGKLRVYAFREAGMPWEVLVGAQYFTQTASMTIGDNWRFLDDDHGNETVATVVAQENITTPAGSYSTFKVNVTLASSPSTITESLWFALGVGYVLDEEYASGVLDWKSWLTNATIVGGTGFLPLAVGNIWVYADVNVAVGNSNWSAVKSLFH